MPELIDFQEVKDKLKGSISCCIIARDEEACIADAIASVRELVNEVIVVDTGSSDGTTSEAKRCGARVYTFPWHNDFSAARNYAISRASKEWILVLDADEVIANEDHDRIRELIAEHPDSAFIFSQRTYTDTARACSWEPLECADRISRGAAGYFSDRQIRLFRKVAFISYRGAVYESVETSLRSSGTGIIDGGIIIHHYGRLHSSERVWRKSLVCMSLERTDIEAYRGSAWYLYETAAQLLHFGAVDEAGRHAARGLEIEPKNWELLNILGLVHMKRKRYGEAEKVLRTAIELSGANEELYNNLGVVLLESGEPAAALESFERGIELTACNEKLLRNAAVSCLDLDKIDEASEYIGKSLALNPFVPHSQTVAAEIHYRRDERLKAVEALRKMKFLTGTPLKVYLKAVYLYIRMKMPESAEEVLLRAMNDHPGHDGLIYLCGRLSEMKGDEEKAIAVYRQLLSRTPEHTDALCSLGCIYERRGDLDRALSNFLEARRFAPENLQLAVNSAIVMGKLGMNDEAERNLRDVIVKNGDYGAAHNALGWHLANQERYAEALPHFRRAVELEPENAQFYVNLGLAYEKTKRYEEAVEVYEKAAFLSAHRNPITKLILKRLGEPVS